MMESFIFIAIDPGRQKCGLAALDSSGETLRRAVCSAESVLESALDFLKEFPSADRIVVGSGTGGASVVEKLQKSGSMPGSILSVAEKNTTLEAIRLFDEQNPLPFPFGFIPRSFLFKPREIDSYAAAAIGILYLNSLSEKQ